MAVTMRGGVGGVGEVEGYLILPEVVGGAVPR